jgi:hypothetical protein
MIVDLLVSIAVTAIVMTAVFPLFLLLYRTEIDFGHETQAGAAGLVAEETLLKDVRTFEVSGTGDNTLALSSLSSIGASSYNVEYSVDSGTNALVRTVTDQYGAQLKRAAVAHYVQRFVSMCDGDPAVVHVSLWVTGSQGQTVELKPALSFSPRNPQACP